MSENWMSVNNILFLFEKHNVDKILLLFEKKMKEWSLFNIFYFNYAEDSSSLKKKFYLKIKWMKLKIPTVFLFATKLKSSCCHH